MLKIIVFSLVLFFPLNAHADWLMLNNGDRISGTIINKTAQSVTINNGLLGDITLQRNQVASIHKGAAPRVLARELRTGQSMASLQTKDTTPASMPFQTSTPVPTPAKVANKDERKEGVYEWSGRVGLGGKLETGNSDSQAISGEADIKARDKRNRFTLGGEANWATEEDEKTDNDQQIYGTYDRFITDKWFVGGRQQFEKDEFEELDLRSQTGIFAGYQFFEQDDLNLQVKAGPEYIYEKFENGDTESDLAAAWALDYDQKVLNKKAQIFHKHELSTPFADTGAFLFESETGARVPIGERLDASFQVDFDWDNDPTEGVQEDDTTYAVKLGYGW